MLSNKKRNFVLTYLALIGSAVFFLYFIFTMEWVSGGADSYSHFLISRYSFQHPELFLHHWGKPFFTLVSSPFAQFGMKGLEVFNLICLLGAAVFALKIAKQLEYKYSWLAVLMSLFAPIVFVHVFSGITEPFGAFLLTLAVYLLSINKLRNAAILFSFLLFVRNEAIVFIPLLILFFISIKKAKYSFYLISAPLIYSVLGSFHYGSLFWIIEQFPYTGAKEIYKSGSLFGFIDSYQSITHLAVGIAFVVGTISLLVSWVKVYRQKWNVNLKLEVLIFLIVAGYFWAHSVAWWLGIGGSLGLKRVLVLIIPLIAVVGVKGINTVALLIPNKFQLLFYLAFGAVVIYIPMEREKFPREMGQLQTDFKEVAEYILLKKNMVKVAYFNPLVPYYLGFDPNSERCIWLIEEGESGLVKMEKGDYLVWDSQFGEGEGRLREKNIASFGFNQLDLLENSPSSNVHLYSME